MKKFKKVLAFAATMAMAMVFTVPVMAKADVTLNVTKPADWKAISVHAWDDEKGDTKQHKLPAFNGVFPDAYLRGAASGLCLPLYP